MLIYPRNTPCSLEKLSGLPELLRGNSGKGQHTDHTGLCRLHSAHRQEMASSSRLDTTLIKMGMRDLWFSKNNLNVFWDHEQAVARLTIVW